MENKATRREFGRYLHTIRTTVFEETIREFAARLQLTPSYTHRLEHAEEVNPTRKTVEQIAERLGMDAGPFLLKAGFVPEGRPDRDQDDDTILLLLGTLTPGQKAAALTMIRQIRDAGIEIPQRGDDSPSP